MKKVSRPRELAELPLAPAFSAMVPTSEASRPRQPKPAAEGRLLRLPLPESDAALVAALKSGRADARDEVVRRCAPDIERILFRVLGPDSEIEDVAHDVFADAFTTIHQLRHAHALRSWLVSIAVRKARKLIRRRQRWRFLQSVAPSELPESEAPAASAEVSEALRSTYRIFARIPADDRVAFALRYVDGMDLASVAEATDVSLATTKRRILRARRLFVELARRNEVLAPWLGGEEAEP
jgi:RNA polymerase sigma-70 factor (ECF subfamily)